MLTSYQPTNIVYSPHTLEPANLKLIVGSSNSDVVVDDLTVTQWKAETSDDSLSEMDEWAYTGGWITTSTNEIYDSTGAFYDDPVANISQCGFVKYKVADTDDEYVYVFTNTVDGVWGAYATFIPAADMTLLGAFGLGGGGGGGQIHAVVQTATTAQRTTCWLTRGGRGGDGLVVLHVRVNNRAVLLQPMRGNPEVPMSVRTPFLNGISLFSFSWKWADSNAVLHVQVATNGVNAANVGSRTASIEEGWTDVCPPILFSEMSEDRRASGSMDIPLDIRAPIGGLLRILVEPSVVAAARAGAASGLDPMYGAVAITGMWVVDNPEKEGVDFASEIISTRVSGGKMVDVPLDWFVRYPALGVDTNDVLACARGAASVATSISANGRLSVADCYMIDLDPESTTNDFKITSFPLKADGTPDIEHIVFDPPQARWNVPATYKVKGAAELSGPWQEVGGGLGEAALPGDFRFFKVEVVLP